MHRGVQAPYLTRTKLWEWPTVLSLDAPLIAVLWQALFAQTFHIPLAWHHALLLAVPIWLVYSADRLLDGLSHRPHEAQTRRHHFYTVHRKEVTSVWLVVLAASLLTALLTLRRPELLSGLLVLTATLGYFAYLHLLPAVKFVPKEVQVALLFGAGVALFLLPNLPAHSPFGAPQYVLPLALFTLLCALNCGLISRWEGDAQRHKSLLRYPAWTSRLPHLALALAGLAALLIPIFPAAAPLYAAVAGGALALSELERSSLSPAALRVLADAALLTPAPILLALWLAGL